MVALHFAVPLARVLGPPLVWIGRAPILVGVVINLIADAEFKRRATTVKPFEQSTALVTAGAFRFTRNPMYLGMVLMLVGVAILLGTGSPFLVVPVFMWLMTVRFIRVEETMLERVFGETFLEYKRRVRRWL